MVCIIFIVHTMHDCWAQLKMGLQHAYGAKPLGGQFDQRCVQLLAGRPLEERKTLFAVLARLEDATACCDAQSFASVMQHIEQQMRLKLTSD
jgi:hypothetical protein